MNEKNHNINIDYIQMGKRIQKVRISHSFTQVYVANRIGISLSHMSNIETGKTKPSLSTVGRISRILNCSIDELIYDDNISLEYRKLKILYELDQFEVRLVEDLVYSIRKNRQYFLSEQ